MVILIIALGDTEQDQEEGQSNKRENSSNFKEMKRCTQFLVSYVQAVYFKREPDSA